MKQDCKYDFTSTDFQGRCSECDQLECLQQRHKKHLITITYLKKELEKVWPTEIFKCSSCQKKRNVYKEIFPYIGHRVAKDRLLCHVCKKYFCNYCKNICWNCDKYTCSKCTKELSSPKISVSFLLCKDCLDYEDSVVHDIIHAPF